MNNIYQMDSVPLFCSIVTSILVFSVITAVHLNWHSVDIFPECLNTNFIPYTNTKALSFNTQEI